MNAKPAYRDLKKLVGMLQLLLAANLLLAVVGLWSGSIELELLHRIQEGKNFTEDEATSSDSRQWALGVIYMILYVATAVVFLRWTYLSNRNAGSLIDGNLRNSPGWSVGWYFVPIATLWKPYQALKEIFQASHPEFTSNWAEAPFPKAMPVWWTLWIISGALGQFILRRSISAKTIDELIEVSTVVRISDLLDIPLMIVAIMLVTRLARFQSEKFSRLNPSSTG